MLSNSMTKLPNIYKDDIKVNIHQTYTYPQNS